MFVLSIQAKKKWGIVVVAAGVLLLALIVIPKLQPDLSGGIPGETNSQRVTFLAQYGWEVEEEPVEIRDVTIPEEFDQVYQQYNEVQKSQGMDLTGPAQHRHPWPRSPAGPRPHGHRCRSRSQ